MPVPIAGQTWYRIRGLPVLDASGSGLLLSLAGGQMLVNGVAVTVRELVSEVPVTTVQTSSAGLLPDYLVPLADPDNDVVTIDWPDDGIEPQVVDLHPNELRALNRAVAEAAGAAAELRANDARLAAESALRQLEALIASGGGTGGGGTVDPERLVSVEDRAILSMFSPSVTEAQAGETLLFDDDSATYAPGPLPTPTVTADDITSGTLSYARLPAGLMGSVDKRTDVFGAAGEWPTTHPFAGSDVVAVWVGDRVDGDTPGALKRASDLRIIEDPSA